MTNDSIGTPEQLRDPNYAPPLFKAIPLGIQHVLAMFVSNITPAIIVAGAAGFGIGSNSPDFPELLYLIQMAMLFAGVATLLQTITLGPVGAALPIVQGTSFSFIPIMVPLAAAGVVSIHNIYPVTLGANVGTTITALLAALAASKPEALTVGLVHTLFNVIAILILYPIAKIREIPIRLAQGLAGIAVAKPALAVAYVVTVFIIVPLTGVALLR